jgi:hypothetical protein
MEKLTHYKLNFLVPFDHAETVKEAIFQTGAGQLGEYQRCAWQCPGQGQFMPSSKANPALGQKQLLNKVDEYRVEILCTEKTIKKAIIALKQSHPYEEPAFEVIKLEEFEAL